jgi:hypothetical protein
MKQITHNMHDDHLSRGGCLVFIVIILIVIL